ncbi:uncharacterized protein TA12850 [Theileria annulata]|uniref:Protein kish n=1 Tax=Theileria annulata TaxID=5874 RepID=Q4UE82_THEAN|nr:uncharacterized protein TA12850 [Theileria annulata]CAI74607.1 hypothetical protein, conserved [Theileria annulata]|eukprot:XP_952339.1 hypothetical protein, conserved [Theileria annulata]
MTALLKLPSLCMVLLLTICTSSYLKPFFPGFFNSKRSGFPGILGKFSVVGDRLSIYVSLSCIFFAFWTIAFK